MNERNVIYLIIILFIIITLWIVLVPYEPMKWDKADATTNRIWVDNYAKGIYEIPFEDWNYKPTQSVVVEHDGEFVVVNEKGPGHVIMLLPFHFLRLEFLFGPFMAGLAVMATYLLGRRLVNWRVGAIASVLVMTNITVLVMWYRYLWTDASTMHMLIFSMWLLVEANHQINKKVPELDPDKEKNSKKKSSISEG